MTLKLLHSLLVKQSTKNPLKICMYIYMKPRLTKTVTMKQLVTELASAKSLTFKCILFFFFSTKCCLLLRATQFSGRQSSFFYQMKFCMSALGRPGYRWMSFKEHQALQMLQPEGVVCMCFLCVCSAKHRGRQFVDLSFQLGKKSELYSRMTEHYTPKKKSVPIGVQHV